MEMLGLRDASEEFGRVPCVLEYSGTVMRILEVKLRSAARSSTDLEGICFRRACETSCCGPFPKSETIISSEAKEASMKVVTTILPLRRIYI